MQASLDDSLQRRWHMCGQRRRLFAQNRGAQLVQRLAIGVEQVYVPIGGVEGQAAHPSHAQAGQVHALHPAGPISYQDGILYRMSVGAGT